jgi:hypothetical protein
MIRHADWVSACRKPIRSPFLGGTAEMASSTKNVCAWLELDGTNSPLQPFPNPK